MVEAAQRELEAAGITEQPGVIVADAGYWHQEQMERIAARASRSWSRPTPTSAKASGPAGTAAPTRSCAPCSKPNSAKRSTKTPGDRRAGVREHQVQPPLRSLPTTRKIRLPLRMAAHHRHPQPNQAPHSSPRRLKRPPATQRLDLCRHDTQQPARPGEPLQLRNSHRAKEQRPIALGRAVASARRAAVGGWSGRSRRSCLPRTVGGAGRAGTRPALV